MNKLNEIKEKKKTKKPNVYLEDVDITKITMTDAAGACSQMNEPYILKSKEQNLDLTEDQIEILKKIGEYDKLFKNKTTKETEMDETLRKEMEEKNAELQKKLDETLNLLKEQKEAAEKAEIEKESMRIEKSLESFELETTKEVTGVLLKLDETDREVITKAFTVLKEFEVKKEEPKEENGLKKMLSKEVGAEGDAEVVEKSINDRISAYRKK